MSQCCAHHIGPCWGCFQSILILVIFVTFIMITAIVGTVDKRDHDLDMIPSGNYHVQAATCIDNVTCREHINAEVLLTVRAHRREASAACLNFWDHACGHWTAAPYYDHVDTFGTMGNRYAHDLIHIFKPVDTVNHHGEREEVWQLLSQLRTYYHSCRQASKYYLKLDRYLKVLTPLRNTYWLAVLAALRSEDSEALEAINFDWEQETAELRRYGLNGVFLTESVGMAHNDSSTYIVQLGTSTNSFTGVSELLNYLIEFKLLPEGQEVPSSWYIQLIGRVYMLDMRLRELDVKYQRNNKEILEESLLLSGLIKRIPNINWMAYFHTLLSENDKNYNQIVPLHLPIELEGAEHITEVAEILRFTHPSISAIYLLLQLCKYLTEVAPQITPENCVHHMGVTMPLGLDYIYDRFIYTADGRRKHDERVLYEIMKQLKIQFHRQLGSNKLALNRTERHFLETKLENMSLRIGNLPQQMPPVFFNAYYTSANLSANDFYQNHMEMLLFRTRQQHHKVMLVERIEQFFVNDDLRQVRNAPYYVHQRNLLIVPMMFLQMPFYHHTLHPLLQYSLVGWILAHEMHHGFEMDGLLFDGYGNEGAGIGEAIAQTQRFLEAKKCLKRQPTATLIERIADVNGFQLVWDAFFGGVTNQLELALHFGTPTDAHQLFFLNFAQFFCGALPRAIDHDRDDVRVNEVVANMREFGEAYSCIPGERENPVQKCEMWRV